ncbi:MAG TPA: hypothetical protein VNM48_17010 [Chloroflexota bacterium]|nr:hypothetical protein [Chloroflexota bacterium]
MNEHRGFIIKCSCGRVIMQCRCICKDKREEVRPHPACGMTPLHSNVTSFGPSLETLHIQEGETELRERLAAIEHQQWVDWQRYFHSKCQRNPDGSLTVPAGYVTALDRLIDTSYQQLPEDQKQNDRKEVGRYWPLIEQHTAALRAWCKDEQQKRHAVEEKLVDVRAELARQTRHALKQVEVQAR